MKKDRASWIGSGIFAVLLALPILNTLRGTGGTAVTRPPWVRPLVDRDLGIIRKDTLRVLVIRDPLTWEEHPGAVSGLEWELLKRFARAEKLPIAAVPVAHPDSMLMMLQRGQGDIMAAQLNPHGWASRFTAFTAPYRSVAPLRVALHADAMVRSTINKKAPANDTLVVSRWSPFLDGSMKLDSATAPAVLLADTALPEDLLASLALGKRPAVLITDATGQQEARRFPHLAFGPRMGRSVPLAFALRNNTPELKAALDTWLASPAEHEARDLIIDSYADARLTKGPLRTLRALTLDADSISPFDSLFQAHADSSSFDWKLLAAVAFKESRFDTTALSSAGAGGLMQIMPATAEALGVDSAEGVGGHIRGANTYLADLDTLWRGSVKNKEQRLKFMLASYNAGPGHIKDAQRLADRFGLDPQRWDGSVERTLLLLAKPRYHALPEVKNGYCRAHETFWFVRDVVSAFAQYRRRVK